MCECVCVHICVYLYVQEIYDDIDHSDCAELLSQKWAKSLEAQDAGKSKKYNLGDLHVPSCKEVCIFPPLLFVSSKVQRRGSPFSQL